MKNTKLNFEVIYHGDGSKAINLDKVESVQLDRGLPNSAASYLTIAMDSGKEHRFEWSKSDYGDDHPELAMNAYEAITGLDGEEA